MKKAFASILLLIYFTVSTGFTVNMHYCMDSFHSWEFGVAEDDKCDECGMKITKSSDCCRDEVKVVKLEQDIFKAQTITYTIDLPLLISDTSSYLALPFQNAVVNRQLFSHSPPFINKQETYLYNCVFII